VTIIMLGILGSFGAKVGGAPLRPGMVRVVVSGLLAIGVTTLVGHLFHAAA
jgi:VIT1/CCC1 family predicted Fe2+/Mn2+ transporter